MARNSLAFVIADLIFNRFLTMPSNRISRSTSWSVICATRPASKSQKALRYPSRFLSIVIQLNPAWALSRTRNSNNVLSSVTNFPHSWSWYFIYSSSVPHQPHRPFIMSCIVIMFTIRSKDNRFPASCQILSSLRPVMGCHIANVAMKRIRIGRCEMCFYRNSFAPAEDSKFDCKMLIYRLKFSCLRRFAHKKSLQKDTEKCG